MQSYVSNLMSSENPNGPYGSYKHFLRDISPNKRPKDAVFDKKLTFSKDDHVQIWKTYLLLEKNPCAVPRQQKIGFKHIPEYSRLKWGHIIYIYLVSKKTKFRVFLGIFFKAYFGGNPKKTLGENPKKTSPRKP